MLGGSKPAKLQTPDVKCLQQDDVAEVGGLREDVGVVRDALGLLSLGASAVQGPCETSRLRLRHLQDLLNKAAARRFRWLPITYRKLCTRNCRPTNLKHKAQKLP